jgi:LEA14-like dessication related protein
MMNDNTKKLFYFAVIMKILRFPLFFLITIAFVISISCSGFENIEVGEIEDVNITRIAGRGIEFEVLMSIDNPSSFRFRITDVDLDVFINKEYIGKISNVDNILVPAGSSELYTFPLKVELSNILKGAISMYNLLMDRQAEVNVAGNISVRSFPITRKIPVAETTHVRLQR